MDSDVDWRWRRSNAEGLTEIASMIVVVFSLGGSAGCLARDDLPGWRSLVDVQQLD